MAKAAEAYALGPTRVQFQNKDPRGWRELVDQLSEHSSQGSARTMRGVQKRRPSLFDLIDKMKTIKAPMLVMTGDEDWPCLEPAVLMKRTIPTAGVVVLPNAGRDSAPPGRGAAPVPLALWRPGRGLWLGLGSAGLFALAAAFLLARGGFSPAPAEVRVPVRSQPFGASVLLDGKDTGVVTNGELVLRAPLPPRVVLTFRKAGHKDETRTIRLPLSAGASVSVK